MQLKTTDAYYYQGQSQLNITKKNLLHVYCLDPKRHIISKIDKNVVFWGKMFPELKEFYYEYLLPELLVRGVIEFCYISSSQFLYRKA